jgi:serine/threonine protein kinase
MNSVVGRTIANRYHVASFLGKGGMANVYKVWDRSRMATLAIKVLDPSLAADPVFWEHFRQEARALADLDHPKIVRFYSLERDGALVFIVMDYAEGRTLKDEMRVQGILSNQRVWEIICDICAALHYAHEKGYVHCDIKPANIILDRNGSALVSDFGIARAAGGYSNTFATGGTAGYMSPEQIRGEPPTRASDIYALGVLLYEMLTGRRPFNGQSAQIQGSDSDRVRWEQLNLQPLSPRTYNPLISLDVERVILRCMDRDPARRYVSVQDILSALDPHLRGTTRPKVGVPGDLNAIETTGVGSVGVKRDAQHKRSQKILLWSIVVSAIIVLLVLMLNTGPTPSNPASIASLHPPTRFLTLTPITLHPPFSIRPFDQNTDDSLGCLSCQVTEFSQEPGHFDWNVQYPANVPAVLSMGWCAIDRATLDSNLTQMDYDLMVDGYNIEDSHLDISKVQRDDGWYCYQKSGVLEGWSVGLHTYVEIQHIEISLFDGVDVYPAGDYIFEFSVTVQ